MKYAAWFLGIIAIVLVVVFGSIMLRNTIRNDQQAATPKTTLRLSDYDRSGVVMRLSVIGPVVANEDHREMVIEASEASRVARILVGYNSNVGREVNYGNNSQAFSDFVEALNRAGFASERASSVKDLEGQCPQGFRYVLSVVDNGQTVSNLWKTSCGGNGSSAADMVSVINLFKAQIPDFKAFAGSEPVANTTGQTQSAGLGLTL